MWFGRHSPIFMHTHPQFRQRALLYRGLANERRLYILSLLLRHPLTCTEIAQILDIIPSAASKHLRKMMTAGLVYGRRRKKTVLFFPVTKEARQYL